MEFFLQIIEGIGGLFPSGSRKSIAQAINGVLYTPWMIAVQVVSGILSIILIYIWVKLLKKTERVKNKVQDLREAWEQNPVPKGKLQSQWAQVQKRLNSNDDAQWKLAIIEADAILDELVRSLGYRGNTMGERMQKIKPQDFPFLDDAWRVHKVRNFIAHDPNYKLQYQAVHRAIGIYKNIFDQFQVLES